MNVDLQLMFRRNQSICQNHRGRYVHIQSYTTEQATQTNSKFENHSINGHTGMLEHGFNKPDLTFHLVLSGDSQSHFQQGFPDNFPPIWLKMFGKYPSAYHPAILT